ncbi:MAG: glycosyltransferase [Myxococcota bacterium]
MTVQLPVFNERNVIERLIDAACQVRWPRDRLEVQVLDDSTDDTTTLAEAAAARWRKAGVDIQVIRRQDRVGFKAGALQYGMHQAKGELLAVFDADFVPTPDFLEVTVPHLMADPKVGMVQARWGHLNADSSMLTQLSAILLDGHFVLEHTARNRSGRFFNFNGTAGIWRRSCIEDAGGWQHDTLTEDLDLSYRAQLKGWRFIFLRDHVVPAELPADMRAFKTQQHRWAKGTLQTARKLMGRIRDADLPLGVKLEAFVHMTSNLAYPLVLLLALLMPVSVAIRGRGDLSEALLIDLPVFLLATVSVGIFYALSQHEAIGRGWLRQLWRVPLVMALGIGMSVNQSRAVLEGLFGSDVTFVRTPKSGAVGTGLKAQIQQYRLQMDWTPILELVFAGYLAAAIVWALAVGYWASVPFMLLFGSGFAFVGVETLRQRAR